MLELQTKNEVESRCGIECSKCHFKQEEKICQGCLNITQPFWGEVCPIKKCREDKMVSCCGECSDFPCDLLKSFAYDKEQGDGGERIENCARWCGNRKKL